MTIEDRRQRYQAIEEYRGRPLIVYATSTRPGVAAKMAPDAVRYFVDQIQGVDGDSIDVLVHSDGGDPLTAWKLMSVLRETFEDVNVLVPYRAFSAATLFALGASQIVMHPLASLGPIDPQIEVNQHNGINKQFAYEDVGAFIRFLQEEGRITEQIHLSSLLNRLIDDVDPVAIGFAKRASELSREVGERLLLTHMDSPQEESRASQIAEDLNKSFFAHGDAVSRSRARELQLQIADDDPDLEKLVWEAFLGIESYMELRQPLNFNIHYLSNAAAAQAVLPVGPAQVPPNAPQQVRQAIWNTVIQNALQPHNPAAYVPISYVLALIESPRLAAEYRVSGNIFGFRGPDNALKLSMDQTENGWTALPSPPEQAQDAPEAP